MPRIGQNVRAPRRPVSGGITAPKGSANSPTTGLGGRRPAPNPGQLGQAKKLPGPTKGGTQPVGAPPAAAAPQQPQTPWDLAAANDEAGAQKRLSNTLSGLDANWLRTQQEYGLEGQWADAASNPYSRSSLLQRSYDNAKRGSMNSAGQNLYAGSYVNSQNSNTHQFNLGRDEMQKAYAQANAAYVGERQSAQDQFNESLNQAQWDRVQAGLESPLEEAPALTAPGAPGKPKKPQKPKKPGNPAVANNRKVTAPVRGGSRKVR